MKELIITSSKALEIEKNIPAQISKLRKFLKEIHNFEIPEQCDGFVARCIRLKDGNLEKATKLIIAFHSAASGFLKWDAIMQPIAYDLHYYTLNAVFPLKNRDPLGRRIIIGRAALWNQRKMSFDELVVAVWMLVQYAIVDNVEDQRQGFITVWDFSGFSLQQVWAIKQRRLISLSKWIHNGVYGRMKQFHIINHPRIVSLVYAGIKPFLSEKMKNRIHFHNDLKSLHGFADPKTLPKFMGGQLDVDECVDKKFMRDFINSGEFFQDLVNTGFPIK